jgi:hypothetical protein
MRRWSCHLAALILLGAVGGCDGDAPDQGLEDAGSDASVTEDAAPHDAGMAPDDAGPDVLGPDGGEGDASLGEPDGGPPTDAGESDPDASGPDAGVDPCAARTGGALVHFQICDEDLALWITDDDFIDEALDLVGQGQMRVPVFDELVAGTDCDPQWSWHVDPSQAEFAIAAIEVCDGCPSFVESELEYWVETVEGYCPWLAEVASVDDRR